MKMDFSILITFMLHFHWCGSKTAKSKKTKIINRFFVFELKEQVFCVMKIVRQEVCNFQ